MLDIKFIKENKEAAKQNAIDRNIKVDIDELLRLYEQKKDLEVKIEVLRAELNNLSKNPPQPETIEKAKKVKEETKELEAKVEEIEPRYIDLLMQVPNMTHPDSPKGKDDTENKEIYRSKEPNKIANPKTHEQMGKEYDLYDFERGAKVSGAKFYFVKNEAALLEQALINYAFDFLVKEDFTPVVTPDLAKDEILEGIGFNPRGPETQIYSIENSDLSLVGTAEITMGGYHSNEIIEEKDLPKKYVALSHCFRTEAGAYGRHSAGLYRVHQFSKVEMFIYCLPEESNEMHEYLRSLEEKLYNGLEIPFRTVDICTGDLGGPAYRKYDLEAWMWSRGDAGDWGEITSTSNCTDYQARRLKIRVKRENGKTEFLHMLNGTAVTTSRTPIAVLENHQQEDGSIAIPEALQKYMGGIKKIIRK
ncbi:MAG: serine--tRNA ligase [Patescibacteria group bacterium]|jgi:seryl-tRNA synthetase